MANFSTVDRIQQTIRAGDPVERIRQENRIKVSNAANCYPPLSKEEARRLGIKINVNWGTMMILLAHARRQYLTAFMGNQYFFKVKLPYAPAVNQSEWEGFITQEINRPMRESDTYWEHHCSRWSSVVLHGVGPMLWYDDEDWESRFLAMSDLRVPTDETRDFRNLTWFAARHHYKPGELLDEVFSDQPNNHWNKKAVASILKNYKELNFVDASNNYDWENSPEKLAELLRQDGGYYSNDAMPSIPLWHFYFEDNTDPKRPGWYLRIVPEQGTVRGPEPKDFLWESDNPVAAKRKHILQCQYGDLTSDPPFMYNSIRGLGFALIEPEFYDNITRCRLMQHIHDNFNIWLRVVDPVDKARAQVQEFSNLGLLRAGVSVVPQNERHQIDAGLVEMAMAQMQQLKQNASSTYTQQIDTGTQKEQTAFETSVKTQQVNAMLSGLLLTAFRYAATEYREVARRFCLFKTENSDVLTFQKRCKQMGIPRQHLNVDLWDIEPVTPLGMGNPTIAQAASQQLMAIRSAYEPTAQQEILHEATLAITGDPRKAARWAPLDQQKDVTSGEEYIQSVFATLMQGILVRPPERISTIEQMDALIVMFGQKVKNLMMRSNVASPEETVGLNTVYQFAVQLIQKLAANEQEKQRVKLYSDAIGKIYNEVKGLAQRGMEQMKKAMDQGGGNGGPGADQIAKAKATMLQAQVKAKATSDKAKLSEQLKAQQHTREQRRKDAAAFAEIQRTNEVAKAQNRLKSVSKE